MALGIKTFHIPLVTHASRTQHKFSHPKEKWFIYSFCLKLNEHKKFWHFILREKIPQFLQYKK